MTTVYKSGCLEVIVGPMKSGKSAIFIRRFMELGYSDYKWITFKPAVNTREPGVASRAFDVKLEAIVIDENSPELILKYLKEKQYNFVGIDEAHFFDNHLVDIIDILLKEGYHVIVSGLILSFRGEPFGPMPWLVGRADEVTSLTAICDVDGCNHRATRSQRLINGEPAPYNSPLIVIEDQSKIETYEARCVIHHIVLEKQ